MKFLLDRREGSAVRLDLAHERVVQRGRLRESLVLSPETVDLGLQAVDLLQEALCLGVSLDKSVFQLVVLGRGLVKTCLQLVASCRYRRVLTLEVLEASCGLVDRCVSQRSFVRDDLESGLWWRSERRQSARA